MNGFFAMCAELTFFRGFKIVSKIYSKFVSTDFFKASISHPAPPTLETCVRDQSILFQVWVYAYAVPGGPYPKNSNKVEQGVVYGPKLIKLVLSIEVISMAWIIRSSKNKLVKISYLPPPGRVHPRDVVNLISPVFDPSLSLLISPVEFVPWQRPDQIFRFRTLRSGACGRPHFAPTLPRGLSNNLTPHNIESVVWFVGPD